MKINLKQLSLFILRILLPCFLIVFSGRAYSQNSFEIIHSTPFHESISGFIELSNNNYLAVGGEKGYINPNNQNYENQKSNN
ncbi:MAG: hypothetical protein K9G58_03965 [Bacteroidales bacterium]|nr:hypothetical protein [Bacteroidales bacterium]MCF8397299.1 hypothetical protein [Bacteroidales bacterium]